MHDQPDFPGERLRRGQNPLYAQLGIADPVTMGQPQKFWDRIADRYSRKPVPDEAAYRKKLEVTRGYLRPDMQVLEFGCGTGSTAIAHAPYVQHIRATDVSPRMIEIARGKAESSGVGNVTFERAAIEELDVADQSLDAVLGLSILHLLEDKEAVIAKVHGMLKPGGIFVTSTACLGDTMKFFKYIGPIGRMLGVMPMVKVFTTGELAESLTAAGFEIDYRWQPGRGKAVFIVAKKKRPGQPAPSKGGRNESTELVLQEPGHGQHD